MSLFSKNRNKAPDPIPYPLNLIKYVQVECINKRNPNERNVFVWEGTVGHGSAGLEIFVDSCVFTDDFSYKESISFLDVNKNPIPMQGYYYYTEDVIAGDCGKIVLRREH